MKIYSLKTKPFGRTLGFGKTRELAEELALGLELKRYVIYPEYVHTSSPRFSINSITGEKSLQIPTESNYDWEEHDEELERVSENWCREENSRIKDTKNSNL